VFLTGASGFVGAHVARALLDRRAEVTVVLRPQTDPWRLVGILPALDVVRVDLRERDACARAIRAAAPDVVCDLAWEGVGNRFHDDPVQVRSNLPTHLALLEAAAEAGCRRWVGLGSQAEYGPQPTRIAETCRPAPATLYGAVKLALGVVGERVAARTGMRFAWLRLFSAYGPMDAPGWLVPSVILTLLRGERPKLTAGTQSWDYLYVEDAAGAIAAAALATELDGVYNLGSGASVPVRDIVQTIRDLVDPRLPLGFGEVPFGPRQIMHLEADVARLSAALAWRPAVSLPDGLARTVTWYREHRHRYGR
jgi:nucleoside-diphosphate-sugar epimerase